MLTPCYVGVVSGFRAPCARNRTGITLTRAFAVDRAWHTIVVTLVDINLHLQVRGALALALALVQP